ncbi:MAG: hypothetical protein EOM91_16685 [Sphingobacteriia bacterium]|nr:hypothetical protein [Sphingobacteriia bacterium]
MPKTLKAGDRIRFKAWSHNPRAKTATVTDDQADPGDAVHFHRDGFYIDDALGYGTCRREDVHLMRDQTPRPAPKRPPPPPRPIEVIERALVEAGYRELVDTLIEIDGGRLGVRVRATASDVEAGEIGRLIAREIRDLHLPF